MTNYVFETLTNEEFVAKIHEMLTERDASIANLEAENKRLRDALEEISSYDMVVAHEDLAQSRESMRSIARRALDGEA